MTSQEHYRESVMNALAGYQIIESALKFYAETYYTAVRAFLSGHLHFDFQRKDVESSPLGRLIAGFSKTCSNKKLVSDLRELLSHRDLIAHQGLLCLYDDHTSEESLHEMTRENHRIIREIGRLQREILSEVQSVRKTWDFAGDR